MKNRSSFHYLMSLFCAITFVAGFVYIYLQLSLLGEVQDPFFIGLLMSNTLIIYRTLTFIEIKIKALGKLGLTGFHEKVYEVKTSSVFGFFFFLIFFGISYIISPTSNSNVNISLGFFLGTANVVTGLATSALFLYMINGYKFAHSIEISLWDRSSKIFSNFLSVAENAARSVALIGCIGIVNASVSVFELGAPVFAFSAFAVLTFLSAYLVPTIPIIQRLRTLKNSQMQILSKEIQTEYDLILKRHKISRDFDSANLENMIRVYKDIVSIRTFPPVGERTVNTALIVTILTVLPSLIDITIRNIK